MKQMTSYNASGQSNGTSHWVTGQTDGKNGPYDRTDILRDGSKVQSMEEVGNAIQQVAEAIKQVSLSIVWIYLMNWIWGGILEMENIEWLK